MPTPPARSLLAATGLMLLCWLAAAQAAPLDRGPSATGPSGLPVPRFVSLDEPRAFMRSGPGERYPIRWDYRRRGLPLLVIGEFGPWRQVRDPFGTQGWMHVGLLTGRRTVWLEADLVLRADPAVEAPLVARAEEGVVARLKRCRGNWCEIAAGGQDGWVPAARIWGIFTDER